MQAGPGFKSTARPNPRIKRKTLGIPGTMVRLPPSVLPLQVLGPFGWPKLEHGLPELPEMAGVYLMTFRYQDGFLPYGVGITRRLIVKRFKEHTRLYNKGEYNILNVNCAQHGVREVVWKGWGWTPEKRADFELRKTEITRTAMHQMSSTCLFIIDTGREARIPERIEAAIANHYYSKEEILFDRGMLRMPRWQSEEHLQAQLKCNSLLVGLPTQLEI